MNVTGTSALSVSLWTATRDIGKIIILTMKARQALMSICLSFLLFLFLCFCSVGVIPTNGYLLYNIIDYELFVSVETTATTNVTIALAPTSMRFYFAISQHLPLIPLPLSFSCTSGSYFLTLSLSCSSCKFCHQPKCTLDIIATSAAQCSSIGQVCNLFRAFFALHHIHISSNSRRTQGSLFLF